MLNSEENAKKLSVLFNGRNAAMKVDINNMDKSIEEGSEFNFEY